MGSVREPLSQDLTRTWRNFAKAKSHSQVHHGIRYRCGSLEKLLFIEDLYTHCRATRQRIDRVHIAARGADVADSCGQLGTVALFMNFCGSNERESRRTAAVLFHGLGPSWDRHSIPNSSICARTVPFARHSPTKFVTEINFSKYYRERVLSE